MDRRGFSSRSLHLVLRRARRGRLLRSRMGVWTSRSSRMTPPPQEGRNVGSSREAPSVSAWPAIQDKSLRVDAGCRMGLAAREEARIPANTRGSPTACHRYRWETRAASRRSCLASLPSCEGGAALALHAMAANQCAKLHSWWNHDMVCARSAS